MTRLTYLVFFTITFSSAAQNVIIPLSPDTLNKGTVAIRATRKIKHCYLTINDSMIIHNKKVKNIEIKNMLIGEYTFHLVSKRSVNTEKLEERFTFSISNNNLYKTKLIETPPPPIGFWIYNSANSILSFLPFLFL